MHGYFNAYAVFPGENHNKRTTNKFQSGALQPVQTTDNYNNTTGVHRHHVAILGHRAVNKAGGEV